MTTLTLGLVGAAAGGLEDVRPRLIAPLMERGWRVAATLTPTAAQWLTASGELAAIEEVTGLAVRSAPRLPGERSPHPPVDCYAVIPATANTVAKLALGVADNQALTTLCETIGAGTVPVVVFPRINAAHARHPAWNGHVATLRSAGVRMIVGDDVWPLHEPRSAPGRDLPWDAIIEAIEHAVQASGQS